jgi:predicted nuclease of predicted toxin-antitoxin system
MPRILLDENLPAGIRLMLPRHSVATVPEMGWAGLTNGDLLAAAERSGFDLMITDDQNIRHQNNPFGRRMAVMVLTTTHWPTIRSNAMSVQDAVERAGP